MDSKGIRKACIAKNIIILDPVQIYWHISHSQIHSNAKAAKLTCKQNHQKMQRSKYKSTVECVVSNRLHVEVRLTLS